MNKIIDALANKWLYDLNVLSQWWVVWLIFPAMLYFVFMLVKWLALTLPLWLPIAVAAGAFRSK